MLLNGNPPMPAPMPTPMAMSNSMRDNSSYLMRVTGWDYYYSFRVSDPKSRWDPGPYSELTTLSFTGDVIRPAGSKYKKATATFSARAGLMDEERIEPARAIGSLTGGGEELDAYVFVPQEQLAELVTVAQSGRVQIIHFSGTKLRYRSALVRSISLHTKFDEDEW